MATTYEWQIGRLWFGLLKPKYYCFSNITGIFFIRLVKDNTGG